MKRKHIFPVCVVMIFAMVVAAPAVAQGPCAIVTGGGQAECPVGTPFKIQFDVSVNCDPEEDSKGFVRVTWPHGLWYKVDIMEAAVVDAPEFYCPFCMPPDTYNRWAAYGPHPWGVIESIITLQGRAVWAWGYVVATNDDDFQGLPILFGVLSKDQNGGGGPNYIFLPLGPLDVVGVYEALVEHGEYPQHTWPNIYFWLGLDQGHVTFNERSLD